MVHHAIIKRTANTKTRFGCVLATVQYLDGWGVER